MMSEGEMKAVLISIGNLIIAPIQIVFLSILKIEHPIKGSFDITAMTQKQSTFR